MSGRGSRQLLVLVAALVPFAAAGISLGAEGQGIDQPIAPERHWTIEEYLRDGSTIPLIIDSQTGGEVSASYGLGKLDRVFDPLDGDGLATARIFSDETGSTWWVQAESQSMSAGRLGPEIGSNLEFEQIQGFQRVADDASLRLVFTSVFIDALDHNGFIVSSECVKAGTEDEDLCASLISGLVEVEVRAWTADRSLDYSVDGDLLLEGQQGDWYARPNHELGFDSAARVWEASDFEIDRDVDRDGGLHAIASLRKPVVVDIPLSDGTRSRVDDQEVFTLRVNATVETNNERGRESWLAVYLRDPVEIGGNATGGAAIKVTGLTPASDFPRDPPPAVVLTPAPCAAPDPNAGTLRIELAEPRALEMRGARWQVMVSRIGGSRGAVSATLTSRDGSAIARSDYEPLATTVAFADGEMGPRNLVVRVLTDSAFEPDEHLSLALSDPGGCATLGDRSSVELTILDDDAPVEVQEIYTVGGTVAGLKSGATLVLEDHHGIYLVITENGPFTFSDFRTPAGEAYSVKVYRHPYEQLYEPIQFCSVSHGSGTFTDHDVTDVLVTCLTQ
jgi:hypothetical protein